MHGPTPASFLFVFLLFFLTKRKGQRDRQSKIKIGPNLNFIRDPILAKVIVIVVTSRGEDEESMIFHDTRYKNARNSVIQ